MRKTANSKWRVIVGILVLPVLVFCTAFSCGTSSSTSDSTSSKSTAKPKASASPLPKHIDDKGGTKTWRKGDIKPGIWTADSPSVQHCKFFIKTKENNLVQGGWGEAAGGIGVEPTDKYFQSVKCGKWTWSPLP